MINYQNTLELPIRYFIIFNRVNVHCHSTNYLVTISWLNFSTNPFLYFYMYSNKIN